MLDPDHHYNDECPVDLEPVIGKAEEATSVHFHFDLAKRSLVLDWVIKCPNTVREQGGPKGHKGGRRVPKGERITTSWILKNAPPFFKC